jgi:signal transduction histidine kinase
MRVFSDRAKLEMIFTNLLENAATYSAPGTPVICSTSANPYGDVTLCIGNKTSQLSRGDLQHICKRFWRKDTTRSERQHAGLGLSIVQSIADILNTPLSFNLAEDMEFKATLTFSSKFTRS